MPPIEQFFRNLAVGGEMPSCQGQGFGYGQSSLPQLLCPAGTTLSVYQRGARDSSGYPGFTGCVFQEDGEVLGIPATQNQYTTVNSVSWNGWSQTLYVNPATGAYTTTMPAAPVLTPAAIATARPLAQVAPGLGVSHGR